LNKWREYQRSTIEARNIFWFECDAVKDKRNSRNNMGYSAGDVLWGELGQRCEVNCMGFDLLNCGIFLDTLQHMFGNTL